MRNIKTKFLILSVLVLSACGTTNNIYSNLEFLSSDYKGQATEEMMKKNLTRKKVSSAGLLENRYSVSAIPLTGAYEKIKLQEYGEKAGKSQEKINADLAAIMRARKSTCFYVTFETTSYDYVDAVNLEFWGVTAVQNGKKYKANFTNPKSKYISNTFTRISSNTIGKHTYLSNTSYTTYLNAGNVCLDNGKYINFKKPFSLEFIPRFHKTGKMLELEWQPLKTN